MKKIIYIFMLLQALAAFPQKEANIWYFGQNAGVDFNSGAPVALLDGQVYTVEGSAVMSDANGNLLFYTDGVTVWNKEHGVMENGTDLLGTNTTAQSALIVPKPGFGNTFYIFTVNYQAQGGLTYSEVDMSANNGLGRITDVKNVVLVPLTTEQVTGVVHQNGSDIWVITHGYGDNALYSFLVTPQGLNTTPVVSNAGLNILAAEDTNAIGFIKASPNGTKIATTNGESGLQLFDFDDATGIISNAQTIREGNGYYGLEFSPSGNLIYVTNWGFGGIEQLNLLADDISAAGILVVPLNGFGENAIQLGPDGKIYFVAGVGLSVINKPDVVGFGCDVQEEAVSLGGRFCWLGLPNFIQSYFNPVIYASDFCFGSATQFSAGPGPAPQTAEWTFGDGETSQVVSPEHTYAAPGTYTVTVTAMVMGSIRTLTKEITIIDIPRFSLGGPYVACTATGISLAPQPTNFDPAQATYLWEFNGQPVGSAATLLPQDFGTYTLTTTVNGCTASQSVTVEQQTVDAAFSEGCGANGYALGVTPLDGSFNAATATYSWAGPAGFNGNAAQEAITAAGVYVLTITTADGCVLEHTFDVADAECPKDIIPKGVSPNGDGKNDVFDLSFYEVAQLNVFNRYGMQVFSRANYTNQWYGQTDKGDVLPDGTYYYHIQQTDGQNITGWVYVNHENR